MRYKVVGLPAILPALWYMASRILSAFSMKTGVKRAMRLCRCTSGYRRPHRFSEAEWRNIADNQDTGYSCFIVVNVPENQVWVNEDTGAGMSLYCFPFLAVMEVAASGAADPWETLLAKYPSAKMSG